MKGFKRLGTSAVVRGEGVWSLMGATCNGCGLQLYPSLSCCPQCGQCEFRPSKLARLGRLYTYSVVQTGQKGIEVPYVVGYVDLSADMRVFGRIDVKPDALEIGQQLELRVIPADDQASQFIYFFGAIGAPVFGKSNEHH